MRVFNSLKWAVLPLTVSLAGCSLFGGAVEGTPATLLAYMSLKSMDKVAVVNLIQRAPDGEAIPAGSAPANMAINPRSDREYLYVANSNTDTVSFLNVRTRQNEVPVTSGDRPWDVAITPDGRYLYVTNTGSKTVAMIDVETRSRVKEFTFDQTAYANFSPRGIATHPITSKSANKNDAYVISEGNAGNKGHVMILRGQQTVGAIEINGAGQLWKAAVTADGTRLLVTDRLKNSLWSVDLSNLGTTQVTLDGNAWDVVVSLNLNKPAAFVSIPESNGHGYVQPIDLSNGVGIKGTAQSVTPVGAGSKARQPQALALNSQGTELWVALAGSNEVVVFPQVNGVNLELGPRLVNYSYTPGQSGAPEDIVLGRGVQ